MKTMILAISLASSTAFAGNPFAPPDKSTALFAKAESDWKKNASLNIRDRVDALFTTLNEANINISAKASQDREIITSYRGTTEEQRNRIAAPYIQEIQSSSIRRTKDVLNRLLSPLMPRSQSLYDFVEVAPQRIQLLAYSDQDWAGNWYGYAHLVYSFDLVTRLTPKGEQFFRDGYLLSDISTDNLSATMSSLQIALGKLMLLPSQRKVLEGFSQTANRFAKMINDEDAKRTKGLPSKSLSHRDFADQAHLMVAYYRYLSPTFEEISQLSTGDGQSGNKNGELIIYVNRAMKAVMDVYGISFEAPTQRIADYGRVLVDILQNQVAPQVDEQARSGQIRPVLIQLGKVIVASQAYGDTAARTEVEQLRQIWESPDFQSFMRKRLSATSDQTSAAILSANGVAYQIGNLASVKIQVFRSEDFH